MGLVSPCRSRCPKYTQKELDTDFLMAFPPPPDSNLFSQLHSNLTWFLWLVPVSSSPINLLPSCLLRSPVPRTSISARQPCRPAAFLIEHPVLPIQLRIMSSDLDREWKPTKMRPQSCVESLPSPFPSPHPQPVSPTNRPIASPTWPPNANPQPNRTMAQDFSTALDSAFSLDSDVNHLSQTIDQK